MPYPVQLLDLPAVVSGLIALLIVAYLYKNYTHPFANIPGPFLAKFTNARFLYHAWKGDLHLDHVRCHKIYGALAMYYHYYRTIDQLIRLQDRSTAVARIG